MDDENVKNKDAEPAQAATGKSNLDEGLDDTFPASDPVSATRRPATDDHATADSATDDPETDDPETDKA